MRLRDTLRLLGGSTTIYVIVAACSAGGGAGFPDAGMDATGPMRHDAMKGTDAPARHDGQHETGKGLMDAITHPVPEASADDTNQSGSRLKTQSYVGTDGSSTFAGMYDSMLKVPCAFTGELSDGSTRCIPTVPGEVVGNFFSDAACSTSIVAVPACSPAPLYATATSPATSCSMPALTQVFAVGMQWSGLVYLGDSASCAAAPMTTTNRYSFYVLKPTPLPPSTFVAGTLTTNF